MRLNIFFLLFVSLVGCSVGVEQEKRIPLKDGEYIFEHKFAEANQERIKSIKLLVKIKGKHIIVINNDRFDVFPMGLVDEGELMWHSKSGQWIIGNSSTDKNEADVGGCSDGPTVVDLKRKIYWTC